jgi:cytochrome c oxidase subunit 1
MMFLFAVPVMQGLGIYFVPLMVGARSIAFPRLVAYSYWMFLFGGVFLYVSFLLNAGPDVGWFSYPPLAESLYSPSKRADVWAQLITSPRWPRLPSRCRSSRPRSSCVRRA